MNPNKTPIFLLILVIGIAIGNYIGMAWGIYDAIWWYDILMHIAGGVFIGTLFFYLFEERNRIIPKDWRTMNKISVFFLALGFVAFIGVLWEFYEYFRDVFVTQQYPFMGQNPGLAFDTLKDLFDDLLGACFAFFGRLFLKQ